jgi:hypothetical protein
LNLLYCFLVDSDKGTGIEGFFRLYPWGKTFFIGAAVGYGMLANEGDDIENGQVYYGGPHKRVTKEYSGLAITPEIGWKVDFGDAGGFYFQCGLEATLLLGNSAFYPRWYLGLGYAF